MNIPISQLYRYNLVNNRELTNIDDKIKNTNDKLQDIVIFYLNGILNNTKYYVNVKINNEIITDINKINAVFDKNNFVAKLYIDAMYINANYYIIEGIKYFVFNLEDVNNTSIFNTVIINYINEYNSFIASIHSTELSTKNYIDDKLAIKANLSAVYTRDEINDKDFADKTYVNNRFEELIGAAPEALDTLEEIAEKLQDGDDIHTALVNSIAEKATKEEVEALQTLTNNCIKTKILTPQNLNANNLTNLNTIYTIQGDMNDSNWNTKTYENFPIKPEGGWTIIVIKEGIYIKQIFTAYMENTIYIRNWNYSGISSWEKIATISDGVASADKLTIKQLTNGHLGLIKDSNATNNVYYGVLNNTCIDKPNGVNSFWLTVLNNPNGFIVQTLDDGNNIYRRINNGMSWTTWKQMITEDNLWSGTQDEYDAITNKDSNTLYFIKEE